MSVSIIKGDLIGLFKQGQFDVLVHGCNCYSIMGAGFAKQIKENFYRAFEADRNFNISEGSCRLGNISGCTIKVNNKVGFIYNAYTQLNKGRNFNKIAFELAMYKIATATDKDFKIAVPGLIGCGLGGGNKDEVMEILERIFSKHNLTIVYPH